MIEAEIFKTLGILSLKYAKALNEIQELKKPTTYDYLGSLPRNTKAWVERNKRVKEPKNYTYLDYLSPEEQQRAEQVSKNNATKRNMYCPKCNEFIGRGSWRSHQDIIDNHKCEE